MGRDFDGDDDNLNVDAAAVTTAPLTMACWFNLDNITANHTLMWLGDKDVTDNFWELVARGGTTGDPIRLFASDAGGGTSVDTTTGFSADTWHHACAVAASGQDRTVFIDGGSSANNTTARTPANTDRTSIGIRNDSTPGREANGQICEVGLWNAALSTGECIALAGGTSPLMIRSSSLVGYWPLWGVDSPEPDYSGRGNHMTIVGALVASHSPTALMLSPPTGWQGVLTVAAGGFTPRSYPRGVNRGVLRGAA